MTRFLHGVTFLTIGQLVIVPWGCAAPRHELAQTPGQRAKRWPTQQPTPPQSQAPAPREQPSPAPAQIVIYGFEDNLEGWVIPDWAKSSPDYVAKSLAISQEHIEEGKCSLELQANFPGGQWAGAYVEREVETTDWTPFGSVSVSLFLPSDAPSGLHGRIILAIGGQWQWTEMNHSVPLTPGGWVTLTANLKPGSMDWKFFPDDAFRQDVRKIGVRIESDRGPSYSGPIFLDNVRLIE